MEVEMGVSYPTVRTRLNEVIRALGYEPGKEEPAPASEDAVPPVSPADRRQVLEALEAGRIGFDEAMAMLKGEK
jgi:hypothetical protein